MKILALIPARMGSSRYPGKPMVNILGKPMIGHVFDRVKQCKLLTKTVVATCDDEIKEYIESINGEVVMTSSLHERATDRCAEGLVCIEAEENDKYDIVVMIQGDEPMIYPEMISEAVLPMIQDPEILVINLLGDIDTVNEFEDRNCIKVVCDQHSNALYFSREPIPTRVKIEHVRMKKQVCVIPFRRDFLLEYTKMKETPLEVSESIDMLRILENGLKIRMVQTEFSTHAVDTRDDLIKVESMMRESL